MLDLPLRIALALSLLALVAALPSTARAGCGDRMVAGHASLVDGWGGLDILVRITGSTTSDSAPAPRRTPACSGSFCSGDSAAPTAAPARLSGTEPVWALDAARRPTPAVRSSGRPSLEASLLALDHVNSVFHPPR